MRLPVYGHTATLLLNGTVLVVGGATDPDSRTPVRTAEIYDPTTNFWTATGALNGPRSGHVAVLLANGKVLVAGGDGIPCCDGLASTELYDPATGTWTATGSMVVAESWLAAVRLATGDVLVVSQNHAERYDHLRGTWSVTPPWSSDRGNLSTLTVLDDGRALVAGGGAREGCAIDSADLYDAASATWTKTGRMVDGHAGAAAALLGNGHVLVAGGGCDSPTRAEQYDPVLGTWDESLAVIITRAEFTTTQLADGRVLVLGGSAGGSPALAFAEVSDKDGGDWTVLANMKAARAGHTATLLPNGLVLVVGGIAGEAATMELYDPRATP